MAELEYSFGSQLKTWRQHRRLSQLALATHSGISQRHISFMETGRSQPSREMVVALADALEVPLRERNAMMQLAGYSAIYPEEGLAQEEMNSFRRALEQLLHQQGSNPTLILDGYWNLVMANTAALRFFALFIDIPGTLQAIDKPQMFQLVRLCLAPEGLRPYITNLPALAYAFLLRARRGLLMNPSNSHLAALIEEILQDPAADTHWQQPGGSRLPPPALSFQIEKDGKAYAFYTMLAHFGAPQHVICEELSMEILCPADDATKRHLEELVG